MSGPTLAELFERHRQGRPVKSLMDVAAKAGHDGVSYTSWREWVKTVDYRKRTQLPSTDTIRAFAAGLGVTERAVLLAAGRSVGLSVEPDSEVDLIIPGAGVLGAADRDMLTSMAAFLMAKRDG